MRRENVGVRMLIRLWLSVGVVIDGKMVKRGSSGRGERREKEGSKVLWRREEECDEERREEEKGERGERIFL